jgi:hypothetical protein
MKSSLLTVAAVALFFSLASERAYALDANDVGDLRLEVAASASPEYLKDWVSTPSEHGVVIKRLHEAYPGKTVYVAFIATGYTPDSNGKVDLVAHWALLGPNGKTIFSEENYATYAYKNEKPGFVMLDPALDILLEHSDPAGTYKVLGVLEDRVAKTKTTHLYFFEFVK